MQSAQHLIELCPQQLVNIIDIQFTGLKYCTTSDSAGFIGKIFIRQTQKILQNPAGSASQVSRFKTISPDTELFTRGCHLWHGTGGTYVGTLHLLLKMAIQVLVQQHSTYTHQPVLLSSEERVTGHETSSESTVSDKILLLSPVFFPASKRMVSCYLWLLPSCLSPCHSHLPGRPRAASPKH